VIPYATSYIWRAKPLIVGNYIVGAKNKAYNAREDVVSLRYKEQGLSIFRITLGDTVLTNLTYINIECISNNPNIITTIYSLRAEICKYNSDYFMFIIYTILYIRLLLSLY